MSDTNKHQALLREALQISELYAHAQFSLGIAYMLGEGVAKDEAEAKRWLQKAADQRNKEAARTLKERCVIS
jgi:TPR repeat protein